MQLFVCCNDNYSRRKWKGNIIKTKVIELSIPFLPLVSKIWIMNINLVHKLIELDIVLWIRVNNACPSLSLSIQLYPKNIILILFFFHFDSSVMFLDNESTSFRPLFNHEDVSWSWNFISKSMNACVKLVFKLTYTFSLFILLY